MNVSLGFIAVILGLLGLIKGQRFCELSDIKKQYLACDENGNRSVIHAKANDCQIGLNQTDLLYSQRSMSCDLQCKNGKIIDFDMKTNSAQCLKCPYNSISEGGNLSIDGQLKQWNKDLASVKGFKTFCIVTRTDYDTPRENEDCVPFTVSEDNSYVMSGFTDRSLVQYLGMLVYGFTLKNKGQVKFTYKKDTIMDEFFYNGQLTVFVDYNMIIKEKEEDSSYKTYTQLLEPGDHHIAFSYDYWVNPFNPKSRELKVKIESLEITGMDETAFECKNCTEGFSRGQCFSCDLNSFLGNECELCPNNKFSFTNSVGSRSCIDKPACDEFDYKTVSVTPCKNGKRKVTQKILNPSFCNLTLNNSLNLGKTPVEESCQDEPICPFGQFPLNSDCAKCPTGFSNRLTNNTCMLCSKDSVPTNVYSFENFLESQEFETSCRSTNKEFCGLFNGWLFTVDKILSGKYFPLKTEVTFTLTKSINVTDLVSAFSFDLKVLELSEDEYFLVELNGTVLTNLTDIQRESRRKLYYDVQPGMNLFTLTYFRNRKALSKLINTVTLSNFKIMGSILGGLGDCVSCPEGSFIRRIGAVSKCTMCPEGMTSSLDNSRCVRCPEQEISDEKRLCRVCSPLTSTDENGFSCNLETIIHNPEQNLLFNLNPLKSLIKRDCESNQNTICYNKKFIGPIRDKSKSKDLFFVSVFEPDTVTLKDFSYERDVKDIQKGQIFGLFEKQRLNVKHSNTSYIKNNVQYENIKLLKNLGSSIDFVQIVQANKKNGIMIEMNEGDVCLEDSSRRYKSYLYLECSRELAVKSPSLVSKLDNNCTYLFKWSTDYACRNCLKKELNHKTTPCIKNRQTIVYTERDDCVVSENILESLSSITNNSIINYSDMMFNISSPIMAEYTKFDSVRRLQDSTNSTVNNTMASDLEFAAYLVEEKDCTLLHSLDENIVILIFCVPFAYFFTVMLFIFIFCRYRGVKKQYELLNNNDTQASSSNRDDFKQDDKKLEL